MEKLLRIASGGGRSTTDEGRRADASLLLARPPVSQQCQEIVDADLAITGYIGRAQIGGAADLDAVRRRTAECAADSLADHLGQALPDAERVAL